jgi:hypothetical protein
MKNAAADDDELLSEYDFSKLKLVRRGSREFAGWGSFRLESALHAHFQSGDQIDAALRRFVAEHKPSRKKAAPRSRSAPDSLFAKNGLVRAFSIAQDLVPYFPTEKSVNDALRAWVAEHKSRRPRVRA